MLIIMTRCLSFFLVIVVLVGSTAGQYFPPRPEGLKTVESKNYKGAKISYKEVISFPIHNTRLIND